MSASNDIPTISEGEYRRRVRQLAHDLRSPLSVICMGMEILGDLRTNEEKFNKMCRMIQTAGTELQDLIDSLATPVASNDKHLST